MMLLFQLSILLLGFLIGSWYFGLTEMFIEDYSTRRKFTINALIITSLFSLYFLLNL